MIHRDLQLEMDATTMARLIALFDPPAEKEQPPRRRSLLAQLKDSTAIPEEDLPLPGALPAVVLVRGGAAQRAFVPWRGVVSCQDLRAPLERRELARWRARHGFAFVVAVRTEALPERLSELQRAIPLDGDLAAQAICALSALLPALERDLLLEPRLFARPLNVPSFELLQRTFDRVLPDEHSFVLYIFERGSVWASLIARKRAGDIDLVTTHHALAARVRATSVKDASRIRDEVGRRFGTPHIAAFVPLGSWRQFVRGDRSALATALAARQAVIDPCPRWLLALIGAGAITEAARRSARLAGKLLSHTPIGGIFGAGTGQLVEKMGNPLEALGLDPWELMRWTRAWSRRALPVIMEGELLAGGEE